MIHNDNGSDTWWSLQIRPWVNPFSQWHNVPKINCSAMMMSSADLDASDYTLPKSIPTELLPFFTVGGLIEYQIPCQFQ
jgi:hypothetical protein